MAHAPEHEAKTLVIAGPDGKFYAIPMTELDRYANELSVEKQQDFDRLLSEATRRGRISLGFYFDRAVSKESASLKP